MSKEEFVEAMAKLEWEGDAARVRPRFGSQRFFVFGIVTGKRIRRRTTIAQGRWRFESTVDLAASDSHLRCTGSWTTTRAA